MGRKVVGNDMQYIEGDLYYGQVSIQQRPPIQQQPPASQPPMLTPGTQVTRTQAPAIQPGLQTTTQPGTRPMVFTPAPGVAPPPGIVTTRPPITPTPVRPPSAVYTMKAYTKKDGWLEQTVPTRQSAVLQMNAAKAALQQAPNGDLVYMELRENGVVIDKVGTIPGTVTPPSPPVAPPPEIPPTITPAPPTDIKLPVAPGTSTDELFNELVVPDDTVGPSTQEQAPPITYTPPPTAPNMFDDFLAWLESVTHLKLRQSTGGFRAPRPRGVLPKRAKALRPERDDDSLPPLEEYEYEDLSDDYVEPELYVDDSMSDYQEAVHQETSPGEEDVDYSLYGIVSNEQRPEPRYERMKMIRREGE